MRESVARFWLAELYAYSLQMAEGSQAGNGLDRFCRDDEGVIGADKESGEKFAGLGKLEFRLGSFHSLLPPEYAARDTSSTSRLRRLWMIRIPNRRGRPLPTPELVEVGRLLAQRISKHCLQPGTPDLSDFQTGHSEGQWL